MSDCEKILKDNLIEPSLKTAFLGVLTFGMYNYTLINKNNQAYYDYRICKIKEYYNR